MLSEKELYMKRKMPMPKGPMSREKKRMSLKSDEAAYENAAIERMYKADADKARRREHTTLRVNKNLKPPVLLH